MDKKKDISNVNFIGSDPEKTIIKFNGYGFNIQSTIFLQNLTLTDLAIINNYRLSATNTIFTQSTGSSIDYYGNNFGGAIYTPLNNYYATLVNLTNCTFKDNYAEYGGAIYLESGNLYLNDCKFINNTAHNYGGAIFVDNTTSLIIITTSFTNNKANLTAGAVYSLLNKLNRGNSIKDMSLGNTFENNTHHQNKMHMKVILLN